MEGFEPFERKTPAKHRNRIKPILAGSVTASNRQRVVDWHEQSGLSISRILDEVITFADTHGYRPGSVSVATLRADARSSFRERD